MILLNELREYAKTTNYTLGQAEKDYYQEILLFLLYQEYGQELVFKGGTALTKCYGFNRFSEDLDFTATKKSNFKEILRQGLKRFYIEAEITQEENKQTQHIRVLIQGPLYNQNRHSLCSIRVDISLRETIHLPTQKKLLGRKTPHIPAYEVIVMSQEEILAEKIRAILTRDKARDLYDLYYLLQNEITTNKQLINQKLALYNLFFEQETFQRRIQEKEPIYDKELKYLTQTHPTFNEMYELVTTKDYIH
ncbi:MAG: nucleotidyl transferase AbiEii/AbiGii toxin family protein [Candidatus Woesearchaeota archaeon]